MVALTEWRRKCCCFRIQQHLWTVFCLTAFWVYGLHGSPVDDTETNFYGRPRPSDVFFNVDKYIKSGQLNSFKPTYSKFNEDILGKRVGLIIITDCAFLEDLFFGNTTSATSALIRYFNQINEAFLNLDFPYPKPDGTQEHYFNYGFTLQRIDLCHELFCNEDKSWDVQELEHRLESDGIWRERVDHGLVLFVTSKLIQDRYGNEYDGFAGKPVCSEDNVAAVSFHRVLQGGNKEFGIRTMAHEMAHALGAKHDGEGDELMRPGFELDFFPKKLTFSTQTISSIGRFLHEFHDTCFIKPHPLDQITVNIYDKSDHTSHAHHSEPEHAFLLLLSLLILFITIFAFFGCVMWRVRKQKQLLLRRRPVQSIEYHRTVARAPLPFGDSQFTEAERAFLEMPPPPPPYREWMKEESQRDQTRSITA